MFNNPSLGKMDLKGVSREVVNFIKARPEYSYRLVIGSDSQEKRVNGHKELSLIGAVVVHRLGKGGRYFYQKKKKRKPHSIREKIYTETLNSLDLAGRILPEINQQLNGRQTYELEIHVDVGRAGETREMIKEIVGMVRGNGYTPKTKPESYGASNVADKYA